jgi:putative DNA primase/helicase
MTATLDHLDARDQFLAAITEAGLTPPKHIIDDGKLHRFSSNGRRGDDAGWYVFHAGDIPAGAFGCWRGGVAETWRADIGRELTADEIAAHKRRLADAKRKREEEEKKNRAKARAKATKILESAAAAPADHPYLLKKGVGPHGLRLHCGELVVPLRDTSGALHSLQFIAADGAKNFLLGGRVTGCYFVIGEPNGAISICEGFATAATVREDTGNAVAVGFNAGNLPPVAKELRGKFPGLQIVVCADDDVKTPGNPGLKYAREAAQAVGGFLAVPDFGKTRPERAADFNDLHQHAGPEAVRACIEKAAPIEPTAGAGPEADQGEINVDGEIARLAKLRPVEYERERRDAAARLGVRASILDKLVAAERPNDGTPGQGRPLELPEPEPWPSPVDGVALVAELTAAIGKYVVLTENDGLAVALWVLHSYCFDAFSCTPRLAITAPEKRCGKTTLLDVIALLVPKALATANISAAALFRTVELARPILLIDEADTFLGENEELRGILNSGHRAGGQVVRTIGEDFEPRAFSTHCPVAIAQIGKLPDTLADRSIHISMRRRVRDEVVSRFQIGKTPELIECARKAARWAADNTAPIRACHPDIPDAIFNRAADNWEPLLAVAEVAGGDLPARARQAALAACGVEEELSPRAMLLADIRDAFEEKGGSRMASADLVAALVAMSDRPWGECNHGKALTQNQLARRLKNFGVHTKKMRLAPGGTAQGYELAAFADAFSRYISGFQSGTTEHTNDFNELREKQSGTHEPGVPVENSLKPLTQLDCSGVPVQNPPNGRRLREKSNNSSMSDADDGPLYSLNSTIRDVEASDGWEGEI